LNLATEIRDNIEIVHTPEYKYFLQYLFPVFYNVLRSTQPQFIDGTEQKIRNILLEILNRLPNNELLRPYVHNLLKLSMFLLEIENEENAVICLRIIIDLHKNYRPTLESEVQPFLDVVQKLYSELPKTVAYTFRERPPPVQPIETAVPPGAPNTGASNTKAATQLVRSMQSFKVLTECPIIVVLLFQLYPRFLTSNIPKFMPLIVSTLALQAPPTARSQHKGAYVDFIAAQVKTLSFLAYMLRGFSEHLRPYQDSIPKCVIQLLLNCPNESATIRKVWMLHASVI
jgi:transformation/transcription domain-associated protein